MGLIRAALGTATGILGDQWKEYFYCDALPANVLARKAYKKTSLRSSNTIYDNVITNGSLITVADGQCMIVVDQGKVTEICAEPGQFTYDSSSEPSIFDNGQLADNLKAIWESAVNRFTFGGQIPKDQRVYYFNTKEMPGNKYGTPNPVPFRVVDQRANIDMDIAIKCFGEYSIKLTNPILFYGNVCGNVTQDYTIEDLQGQMRTELLTALQPAFARISAKGVRYSEVPAHTMELADALNEELSNKWKNLRGIEIVSFGISSMTADEDDEKMLKDLQRAATLSNPNLGAGYMAGAYGQAIQDAANNANGAVAGMMGVGMMGGVQSNIAGMYAAGQQAPVQPAPVQPAPQAAPGWICPTCGRECAADDNFCPKCGARKPVAPAKWICPKCGKENDADANFCGKCGERKPE